MSLRCKPGDLAVIVNPSTSEGDQFIGRILKIQAPSELFKDSWETSPTIFVRGLVVHWKDSSLRPIRDQPGEDETLRIAGRPLDIEHA